MPKLGESVTEGTINSWLVKEGDYVNKYDPIAEVMTDKVNAEVPSSYAGTIKEIVAKEGETKAVGELICYIETEEAISSNQEKVEKNSDTPTTTEPKDNSMKTRYSHAVLKLASEHNIDLQSVQGSGMGGRITRKDIRQIIANKQVPVSEAKKTVEEGTAVNHSEIIEIPLTGVRKTIAENMVRSKTEIPHAWMTIEADVTDLVTLRNNLKNDFKVREGYNLTYFAFFVSVIAKALKEYPQLNSTWKNDRIIQHKSVNISIAVAHEDQLFVPVIKHADEKSITGIAKENNVLANKARTEKLTKEYPKLNSTWKNDRIIQHKSVNISIAVAHEDQLFVPVIKHADEKSITGIAKEINVLANKARTGKLTTDDMQGGTFTVNNTGTFGSISSMGIINYPQAAILQVESIVKRPVIIDNMFAARDIVNLSLSLDHRILDGLICGRFLQRVRNLLENINEKSTNI